MDLPILIIAEPVHIRFQLRIFSTEVPMHSDARGIASDYARQEACLNVSTAFTFLVSSHACAGGDGIIITISLPFRNTCGQADRMIVLRRQSD